MSDRPNVTVQVLPFTAGAHPGVYGPFVIMGFAEPGHDVVWVENLKNSVYFDSPDDVDAYAEAFDHLRACALSPQETLKRVKGMIGELS